MSLIIWTGAVSGSYSDKNNWQNTATGTPSVPISGDYVLIDGRSSRPITSGLNQSAVTLTSFKVMKDYLGTIGTDSEYLQLRSEVIDIGAYFGSGTPAGSSSIRIDLGQSDFVFTLYDSPTTGLPVDLKCDNDSSAASEQVIVVKKGRLSFGYDPQVQSNTAKMVVGSQSDTLNQAYVFIGSGSNADLIDVNSGNTTILGTMTNLTVNGGTCTVDTPDSIYQYIINGGICYLDRFGTIENFLAQGGLTDMLRTSHERTITVMKIERNTVDTTDPTRVLLDPNYVETLTNLPAEITPGTTLDGLITCK